MKLVIDTNIIIASLIRHSQTRSLILSNKFYFVSPDFVLDEINKYKGYICQKAKLSPVEFDILITLLFQSIEIISKEQYAPHISQAKKIMAKDKKDIPFVACYLALRCDGIWTNDSDYNKMDVSLKILTTVDLIRIVKGEA